MPDLGNWGQFGVLTQKAEYGQHVALRCKNHPHLRWSTKNIAPIGARNIFFCGDDKGDSPRIENEGTPEQRVVYVTECDCPIDALEVVS